MKFLKIFSPKHGFQLAMFLLVVITSCKKMIDVDLPINNNTTEQVFGNKSTATAAMSGIYAVILRSNFNYTSVSASLLSDELTTPYIGDFPEFTNNVSGTAGGYWALSYKEIIYRINGVIEGLYDSKTLPEDSRQILLSEAKFTRAWIYFYLVNYYGDIPIVLTTDFRKNSNIPRASTTEVYNQIIKDLNEAKVGLTDIFLDRDLRGSTLERVRPNKAAATALLARVYLYISDWQKSEIAASEVISNQNYELLEDLDKVFLKNSKETIWALQPNPLNLDGGANTTEGQYFINPFGGDPWFALSSYIVDSFEPDDNRKIHWTNVTSSGSLIPYKYKKGWGTYESEEYSVAFRLAELYLIRAEARVHLGKLTGENSSQSDLNKIRNRAGLGITNASTSSELINAISRERQLELFTEWGDRWFDLKRTGKLDEIMRTVTPLKGGSWSSYKALLPIPFDEFKYNQSLRGHQNPGYQEQN